MTWSLPSYLGGLLTIPAAVALLVAIVLLAETGTEIECSACGYSTGPMHETARLTRWLRWQWHKRTTGHHTRRWQRAHSRPIPTR